MRQSIGLVALIFFVAGVSLVLSAQDQTPGGKPITVTMTGPAEVPGPGDPDGTGTATITLNPGKGQVCYELTVDKIGTATAAHIHEGAVDKAGPPIVMLNAPASGTSKDCATLAKDKIMDIIKNPAKYYVNVHNEEYPNGAVRGQLGK